jgi:hypothetical protein
MFDQKRSGALQAFASPSRDPLQIGWSDDVVAVTREKLHASSAS